MRGGGLALIVDRVACDGHGLCAELFPERITLDEWGYPLVDPTPIPDGLATEVRRAVAECPNCALRTVPISARVGRR